jgi:hypothetical protein
MTRIIDYCGETSGTASAHLEGKFLQLCWRGEEYLVFAPAERHRYHNQILSRFLQDQGIPHRWIGQEKLEVDDPDLVVIGGGRFRASSLRNTLELWDDSHAYGRFREAGLAEGIAAAGHAWSGFELRIA